MRCRVKASAVARCVSLARWRSVMMTAVWSASNTAICAIRLVVAAHQFQVVTLRVRDFALTAQGPYLPITWLARRSSRREGAIASR